MPQIGRKSKHAYVSVREGIKRYGDKAIQVLIVELLQIDDKGTFNPQIVALLTTQQKQRELNLLTVIKQKRCGKIKRKGCCQR